MNSELFRMIYPVQNIVVVYQRNVFVLGRVKMNYLKMVTIVQTRSLT